MNLTPNAASVALIRQREVLLIQRAYAPWQGAWTLPGGRTEAGETAEACAVRELREELGLSVSNLRPVTEMTLGTSGQYRLAVFASEDFGGDPAPSDEISDWRWMRPESIGALPVTPDLASVLDRAFGLFVHAGASR